MKLPKMAVLVLSAKEWTYEGKEGVKVVAVTEIAKDGAVVSELSTPLNAGTRALCGQAPCMAMAQPVFTSTKSKDGRMVSVLGFEEWTEPKPFKLL